MIQSTVFDVDKIQEVQPAIYRSTLSAKGRPRGPEPTPTIAEERPQVVVKEKEFVRRSSRFVAHIAGPCIKRALEDASNVDALRNRSIDHRVLKGTVLISDADTAEKWGYQSST